MRRCPQSCGFKFGLIVARLAQPPSSEITWVHASVRGRHVGRQHDAGLMQVRRAHLTGVLDVDNSLDQGIIGTASLGDLEGLRSGRQR